MQDVATKAPKGEPRCDTDQGLIATVANGAEAKRATVTTEATKARKAEGAIKVTEESETGDTARYRSEEIEKIAQAGESE